MPLKLDYPREGKTPFYYVRGTHLGVFVNRSTKTADRALAKKELKRIELLIERGRYEEKPGPSFADAVTRYVRAGGDDRFLRLLLDHFQEMPLADLTQTAIDDAAAALYPNASPATRNRQVYTPMSAVLKRAGVKTPLDRPKGSAGQKRTQWLWPEEAGKLFEEAGKVDRELAVLLILLTYTGLRLGEALWLQVRDLRLDERFVYVPTSKNEEPRAVHLPPFVVAALSGHPRGLDRGGRIFRFTKGQRLYQKLARATEAAGCPWFTFHAARHTWATWMRRYGGLDTRGLVGTGAWKDSKSAARYEHVVTTDEARRSDLLPVPDPRFVGVALDSDRPEKQASDHKGSF